MKTVLREMGASPVSRKLFCAEFAGLGPVDVVCEEPRFLMELKWSYERPGKVFESVWDAIKLAMLGASCTYSDLFLFTGASHDEWESGDCVDLFAGGPVNPRALWDRPLDPRRGPNYGATVGQDLVIGATGNQPAAAPLTLDVSRLERLDVGDDFALTLIRVEPATGLREWLRLNYP